jgi:DNA-binding transcriptional ArsR family regulator
MLWYTAPMRLFGSPLRARILVALALLEESYASELARVIDAPLFSVQRAVDALEADRVLTTRTIGKERRVALNPRFTGANELNALLRRLAIEFPDINMQVEGLRRRPRAKGKALAL